MTESAIDFHTAFNALPGNFLILKPDSPYFTILAVSDELLEITSRERQEVVGKSVFKVYPENPGAVTATGPSTLRISIQKAIKFRKYDQMPTVRYDVTSASGAYEERYWSANNKPVLDSKGEVAYIIHSTTDITEQLKSRKQNDELNRKLEEEVKVRGELTKTQNALKQFNSELEERVEERTIAVKLAQAETQRQVELLYQLFLQAPAPIAILEGENMVFRFVNPAYQQIFPERELKGKGVLEALPELKNTSLKDHLEKVYQTGETFVAYEMPFLLARHQGEPLEELYFNFTLQARRNQWGEIDGILNFAHEVTEQVKARKKTEESEQQLRSIIESSPYPLGVFFGKEMRIQFANKAIQDSWGKGSDVVGKLYRDILPELENQAVFEEVDRVYETGIAYYSINKPLDLLINGQRKTVYYNYSFTPLFNVAGEVYGIIISGVDNTELILTQQKVQESESRFRSMIEQIPVAIGLTRGKEHVFEDMNPPMLRIIGREHKNELLGKKVIEVMPEIEQQEVRKIYQDVLETGKAYVGNEVPVTLRQGDRLKHYYLNISYTPLLEEGKATGLIHAAVDVTEQVEARKKLEEANRQIQDIIESSSSPLAVFMGKELRIKFANKAMQNSFGKGPGIIGKHYKDLMPELENQDVFRQLDQVFKTGIPFSSRNQSFELVIDGQLETHYYTYSFIPLFNKEGQVYGIVNTASEVTDLIHAQQRIENYARELEESAQRFRSFVQASNDTLYRMSPDWNQMLTLEGKHFDFFVDKPKTTWVEDYLPPQDKERALAKIQEAMQAKGIFELEHRVFKADGTIGWTISRAIPVLNQEGEIMEWFGAATDITEQKMAMQALEESEQRFRIMADAAPNMVWALSQDGSLKYANKFMLDFLGISMEQCIADNWIPYLPQEDLERTTRVIGEAIAQRKPFRNEHRFLRRDGEYRWLLAQAAPSYYPNGDLYGYVGSSIDITEIREAEQSLQRYARKLADANKDISNSRNELEQKNSFLTRLNADLDSFIYTASHDLKTPINNIEGLMAILSRKMDKQGWQDPSIEEVKEMITTSITRFKRTVADLADISKVERQLGEESKEIIELPELISDILLDLSIPIQESKAVIEQNFQECHSITFSEKNLKSMLYNLISNAIKYRHPERNPLVSISCHQQEDYLVIAVTDNGLGLKSENINKIFGMFQRQHNHVEGTGVGLYIVKKMIENAGGKITVDSTLGEGSEFHLYIPYGTQEE